MSILELNKQANIHTPEQRGLLVLYRPDHTNYCPGCGRTQWHVGRQQAECAFCGVALDIAGARSVSSTRIVARKGPLADFHDIDKAA